MGIQPRHKKNGTHGRRATRNIRRATSCSQRLEIKSTPPIDCLPDTTRQVRPLQTRSQRLHCGLLLVSCGLLQQAPVYVAHHHSAIQDMACQPHGPAAGALILAPSKPQHGGSKTPVHMPARISMHDLHHLEPQPPLCPTHLPLESPESSVQTTLDAPLL